MVNGAMKLQLVLVSINVVVDDLSVRGGLWVYTAHNLPLNTHTI